jgi:hypothetical protein
MLISIGGVVAMACSIGAPIVGAMSAIVIYESLRGNTQRAGELIAAELTAVGTPAVACPIDAIDMQALSDSDTVIVGSWTDGFFFFGQRPGRPWRLAKLPVIDGKRAFVYCTYAKDPAMTLTHLSGIVRRRGGDVQGGYAIHRKNLEGGALEFVARLRDTRVMGAQPEAADAQGQLEDSGTS